MKSPLDCISLLKELPSNSNTSSPSTVQSTKKDDTLSKPDWSLLPDELLQVISEKLDNCFDVIHARSVCRLWRSIFSFPSCLLRTSYSIPPFSNYDSSGTRRSKGWCTIEKFPMFLFRVRPPAGVDGFFMGGINRDMSEDHMGLRSPFQCTVKVNFKQIYEPILLNVLHCQIFHMGYQFRMVGWGRDSLQGVAFLPLDKDGGKEFVVLIGHYPNLLVFRSSERRWRRLGEVSIFGDIVTFRGKFYVTYHNNHNDVFVIDPYSLEATPLVTTKRLNSQSHLVPSGNDELFLVEEIYENFNINNLPCRVCRLDEEAGAWVLVTELGDRVLLIGPTGNSSFSAKELPHGCGVSGNSFLFNFKYLSYIDYFYKYGVDTGNAQDNLSLWRKSREAAVIVYNTWLMVIFRADRFMR